MKHYASILTACIILILMGSCHSSRKAATEDVTVVNIVPIKSSPDFYKFICSKIIANQGNWEYLKIPVTMKLSKPKDMSINGTAWMQRDSSIAISLRYMGFEVGSLSLTADSITVIDKMHKSYMTESLDKFLDGMNFDLSNLQNILLGLPFQLGQKSISESDLMRADIDTDDDSGEIIMIPADQPESGAYGFSFLPWGSLNGIVVQSGQHEPVTISYNIVSQKGNIETPAGDMARDVNVTAMAGKIPIDATIVWNFDKAKWNDPSQHRTVRPGKNYKRLDSSQIPRILKNI